MRLYYSDVETRFAWIKRLYHKMLWFVKYHFLWVKEFRDVSKNIDAANKLHYITRFYYSRAEEYVKELLEEFAPGWELQKRSMCGDYGVCWFVPPSPCKIPTLELKLTCSEYVWEDQIGRDCSRWMMFSLAVFINTELYIEVERVDCREKHPWNWFDRRRFRSIVKKFVKSRTV